MKHVFPENDALAAPNFSATQIGKTHLDGSENDLGCKQVCVENIIEAQRKLAAREHVPIMQDDTLLLLQSALRKSNSTDILEIGTAIGYSTLRILQCCPSANVTSVEIDANRHHVAKDFIANSPFSGKARLLLADADELLRYSSGTFDFIFLDGAKGHYARQCYDLNRLLSSGGTLFADNVLFKGKTQCQTTPHKHRTIVHSLRAFCNYFQSNPDYSATLHNVGDGVLLAIKK